MRGGADQTFCYTAFALDIHVIWGLLSYHHISMTSVWKNCYNTISLWPPTNSGAKNLNIVHRIQNLQKILANFFGGLGYHRPVCLFKKNGSFLFESVLKLELWNIQSQLSFKLFVFFWTWNENVCPSLFWTTNSYFICGQASMLNLDIKINVSFESQHEKNWIISLRPFFKRF